MFKRAVSVSTVIMLLSVSFLLTAFTSSTAQAVSPTKTPVSDIDRTLALNQQGQDLYQAGRYQEAIAAWEEALKIMQRLGYVQNQGVLLSNIGAAYERLGQLQRSLTYYDKALKIARQAGNVVGQAQTLTNIGNTYIDQGRYTEALDFFNKALAIMRQLGEKQAQAVILNSIGTVYQSQGNYTKAMESFQQALTLSRAVRDRQHEGVVLSNIAGAYQLLGQYARALDYNNQALAIAHEVEDPDSVARIFGNIGALYAVQEQYDRALTALTEAVNAKHALGDRLGEAQTLINIGAVYNKQGLNQQALDTYHKALEIEHVIGNLSDEGSTLNNLGVIYKQQKDYAAAADAFNQSLVIRRMIGDRVSEAGVLGNLGGMYYEQERYDLALDTLQQAIALDQDTGNLADKLISLNNLGLTYEALHNNAKAIESYEQSVEAFELLLDNAALESTIVSLLSSIESTRSYHRLAYLLAQAGKLEAAINYTERGHAILARAELIRKPLDVSNTTEQTLIQKERDLWSMVDGAQKTLNALQKDISASADDLQAAQSTLEKARRSYQSQLEVMQVRGGLLTQQLTSKVATLSQMQAVLPADTTLVLYSIDEQDSVVFLITRESVDAIMLNSPLLTLTSAVKTFTTDRQANAAILSSLYTLLIEPVIPKLKTSQLLIAPDSVLAYVPFAALQNTAGRALIDDYAITMIPSGTLLALLNGRKPQGVATNPGLVLAQADAPGLPRLQFARSEADTIAKLLGVKPVLNATVDDLVKKSTGSKVIHISAHAELDIRQPLFSTIFLNPGNSGDEGLAIRQIYKLNLTKGTQLVILSGCNTASGGSGENFGVMTRAFFAAGTPRVVASLWSVDDESTSLLITSFMAERKQGLSDAEALRKAMLITREKYPEPYYWASFVLSGLPGK
jgi:tetratricopeptide (TPR) repeat protein